MSNDSTNKVDPVIKCFFVSFCTIMAVVFILSFSIKVLILCFVIYGLIIIPLNTLFIYVISRIRLFRWSLHSVWYVIFENLLLLSHMCLYDRITLMYFPKLRFNTLCYISVFIAIQLVFVLVASICRNRMIKKQAKTKGRIMWRLFRIGGVSLASPFLRLRPHRLSLRLSWLRSRASRRCGVRPCSIPAESL